MSYIGYEMFHHSYRVYIATFGVYCPGCTCSSYLIINNPFPVHIRHPQTKPWWIYGIKPHTWDQRM